MGLEKFQRNTQQRQIILEELQRLTSHPTATDLYDIVRQRLPKISLGTIYRNLDHMAELSIIQKIVTSGKEVRFDGNPDQHDHLRCQCCGRIGDLFDPHISFAGDQLDELNGWRIIGRRLEFVGICPECRKEDAEVEST